MERALEKSVHDSYGHPTKYQPMSNNASKCGHPCAFFLWARRALWEEMPSLDPGLLGVFKIGREAEREIKRTLLKEGWTLTHDEVTFEDKDLQIRGRLDWYLSHSYMPGWEEPVPTEFKSVAASYFNQIHTFEDCYRSHMTWVRLWPYQPLVYAYLAPEEWPYVCLLLRNKGNGRVKAIVERADDHFERLVEMGEVLAEVNAAMGDPNSVGPAPMTYRPSWCDNCDAKAVCPTMRHTKTAGQVVVIDDPSVMDDLADVYTAAKEHKAASDAAWDEMKSHCRHYGAYDGAAGETRTVMGERYIFTVKQGKKSGVLKVLPVGEADAEAGG
jgi:hypothetical protein